MKSVIIEGVTLYIDELGVIYRNNKLVKTYDNGKGYKTFYCNYRMHYVHRAVCEAYHGISVERKEVNHINGIKEDNRPANLEWCTRSYNIKHSFDVLKRPHPKQQLGKSGSLHHNSKAVNKLDPKTDEVLERFGSTHEAAKAMGVHQSAITAAIFNRNRMKYCKGFKMVYA